ncbi:MAG: Rpn family recombination-promoting nuclease/putative transposase [Deltaproteobacteria bacterium]|nr:Rpn family recombination-promoting nuclease/putative transposase [Deltaproteobacteria bacterium]
MDHDGSYKRIFSEPRMVQDLLTGFVKQQWVNELDFTTLEQITSEHISDNFDKRFNDTVWKVKFHNSWMYICILLEFQSTPDKWMSLRIMTYLGLLYETLVRNNEILKTGKLPPVIPIVLYNGTPRWRESTQISDLIDYVSEECDFFRPHLSYLLIDEGAIQSDLLTSPEMKDAQNLVASLFALENAV